MVFNGSQRIETGFSVNECLHTRPTILSNLVDILLRWRPFRIVAYAHMEKIYRKILAHRDDQDLQLILGRHSLEKLVQTYRLATVTYVLSCVHFLILRCLQ